MKLHKEKDIVNATNKIQVISQQDPMQESHQEIEQMLKPQSNARIYHVEILSKSNPINKIVKISILRNTKCDDQKL